MTIEKALLILLALAVGWILLKVVLSLTMRIFTCGCMAILVIGGIWLLVNHVL